jgi:hydrogenase/urease accessory protein HupE
MLFYRYILVFLFLTLSLNAHQTGLSYVNLKEFADGHIDVIYKKPLEDTKAQDIFIHYPMQCIQSSSTTQSIVDGYIIHKYSLNCSNKTLANSKIWVEGLVSSDRGVLIRYEKNEIVDEVLLRATTPFMNVDYKSSKFELFREYASLGVEHILLGYDHLMFVFALVLLSFNLKSLLWAISAFTLSHSITLAFGVFGTISVGIAYIEAMVAFSIMFLAREIVVDDRMTFTRKYLGSSAFIFGLLHGFGFSSILQSIGLPQHEIPFSLFSFNFGIELGQIVFIVISVTTLSLLGKVVALNKRKFNLAIAYIIGALSSMWFVARVIAF